MDEDEQGPGWIVEQVRQIGPLPAAAIGIAAPLHGEIRRGGQAANAGQPPGAHHPGVHVAAGCVVAGQWIDFPQGTGTGRWHLMGRCRAGRDQGRDERGAGRKSPPDADNFSEPRSSDAGCHANHCFSPQHPSPRSWKNSSTHGARGGGGAAVWHGSTGVTIRSVRTACTGGRSGPAPVPKKISPPPPPPQKFGFGF